MVTKQTTPIDREKLVSARELVASGFCTLGGKFALQIIDLALAHLDAAAQKPSPLAEEFGKEELRKAWERFSEKFNADNCVDMTDDQWGDWLNKLPRIEFFAMLEHGGSDAKA